MSSTRTPDAEALLARLVGFESVAGASNIELVEDVAEYLAGFGVASEIIAAGRSDAANLYAVIGPSDVRGVLLSAHLDVVSTQDQCWSYEPFQLTRNDGRLYGRGTTDMKGFVAAVLAIVPYAAQANLRRPLHLGFSMDEELGCKGIGPMLDHLEQLGVHPAFCVVGEPTSMRVAVKHKGKVAYRVSVRGRGCHSSRAPYGVNAVEYAARLIIALADIRSEVEADARDADFPVPHATLSVGPIHGGVFVNLVPELCTFDFELRVLPGQRVDGILALIQESAAALETDMRARAPEARITFSELTGYPPLAPADFSEAGALVADMAGTTDGSAVDFGSEAGLYQSRLQVPVVLCGPGDMARAHRADEYLEADELEDACAFLRRLVDWLNR